MKFISSNPNLFEVVHNWAGDNPSDAFIAMVIALAVGIYIWEII